MLLDINNVDWSLLQLAKSGRGVKLIYNKEPVQFCTSSLYTPFGVNSLSKEWSNFNEYNVECSLNQSSSPTSSAFRLFLETLDSKIAELVTENAHLFANGTSGTYTSILRDNGNYPKRIKLQFPRDKNGNFESVLFDDQKQKLLLNETNINECVSKGKIFKCIIECAKVWSFNGKVGSIWNIVQLKFSEQHQQQQENAFTNSAAYTELVIED